MTILNRCLISSSLMSKGGSSGTLREDGGEALAFRTFFHLFFNFR